MIMYSQRIDIRLIGIHRDSHVRKDGILGCLVPEQGHAGNLFLNHSDCWLPGFAVCVIGRCAAVYGDNATRRRAVSLHGY